MQLLSGWSIWESNQNDQIYYPSSWVQYFLFTEETFYSYIKISRISVYKTSRHPILWSKFQDIIGLNYVKLNQNKLKSNNSHDKSNITEANYKLYRSLNKRAKANSFLLKACILFYWRVRRNAQIRKYHNLEPIANHSENVMEIFKRLHEKGVIRFWKCLPKS